MRALFWLGLGAGAMYFLDPDQGARRRALLRDKAAQYRQRSRPEAPGRASEPLERAQPSETPPGAHHLGR